MDRLDTLKRNRRVIWCISRMRMPALKSRHCFCSVRVCGVLLFGCAKVTQAIEFPSCGIRDS